MLLAIVATLIALGVLVAMWPKAKSTRFQGKHVLVTGGSKGIGYSLAEEALARGANVSIVARNKEDLAKAALELEALGLGKVASAAADTTNADQVRARTGVWLMKHLQ